MENMKDIIKLAIDCHRGVVEKYSVAQGQDVIRQGLLEVNNGKDHIDIKDIRDGKCVGLFAFIETVLANTAVDAIQDNPYIQTLCDFRNLAIGDKDSFLVEDSDLFTLSKAADGTQGIRRQRLGGITEVTVPTELRIVKIYEELNRVLSGRVDFNHFINKVSESFAHTLVSDVNSLWGGIAASQIGGVNYYPTAGTYSEDALLDTIAHVEAASGGKTAVLMGTKKALRKLIPSVQSDSAKEDLYNLGYCGKFFSSPVVAAPQRHSFNTSDFMFDDKTITIIAGDEKPIKITYEGDPTVLMGDPLQNKDFTQDFLYAEKYGLGVVMANGGNSGIGIYKFTS